MNTIYPNLLIRKQQNKKSFAILIDPDSTDEAALTEIVSLCNEAKVDFILVGGSLITNGYFEKCIETIKMNSSIPCIIFPGNSFQISKKSDAILLLSLISGRNPELLIGNHVLAASQLKRSALEIIPTGYMLIDGGRTTSVSYMSNTVPIPADKYAIAASTALAGEMLGLKIIYMDAGSGALYPVPSKLITEVSKQITVPVFVGGGIKNTIQALEACHAGADVIVVGNAIEKDTSLIKQLAQAIHSIG
ncbi:MAG: geranylgeranylglyceryl/heptaprenylglyceryl phosphate synthase [Bacteroidetes bacterium]|nr:geranylgeranylglyceryl/heptaprenylglyceryl phosphate synthase [Bacteroidota bacterium]